MPQLIKIFSKKENTHSKNDNQRRISSKNKKEGGRRGGIALKCLSARRLQKQPKNVHF